MVWYWINSITQTSYIMKKFYFLLIVGFFCSVVSFGQNADGAKKILDAVSAKIKSSPGVSANFTMTTKARTGKLKNTAKGSIALKGSKYYIKQGDAEIFSDGKKIWNFNGSNEVTVTDGNADNNSLSPEKIFSGQYDIDYTYKIVSTKGTYNQVQLIPIDKRKQFQRITLYVDKNKSLITQAMVLDKSNNTIIFSLSGIDVNSRISDETFVFNRSKYKGNIEVIE